MTTTTEFIRKAPGHYVTTDGTWEIRREATTCGIGRSANMAWRLYRHGVRLTGTFRTLAHAQILVRKHS